MEPEQHVEIFWFFRHIPVMCRLVRYVEIAGTIMRGRTVVTFAVIHTAAENYFVKSPIT